MYVYDHEALKQLANEYHGKLFNFEHLVGVAAGNCERPDHVQGFRTFEHVQWLASSGGPGANRLIPNYQPRLVYVYGSPAEWCGDMALSEPDMPFTWGTLRKLLSKTLTSHGKLKTEYTVFQWRLVDRPEDAEVRMPTSVSVRSALPLLRLQGCRTAHSSASSIWSSRLFFPFLLYFCSFLISFLSRSRRAAVGAAVSAAAVSGRGVGRGVGPRAVSAHDRSVGPRCRPQCRAAVSAAVSGRGVGCGGRAARCRPRYIVYLFVHISKIGARWSVVGGRWERVLIIYYYTKARFESLFFYPFPSIAFSN